MIQQWQVESNKEVHGVAWTAQYLKKKGYCFALAYFAIFGKMPRI